MIEVTPAVDGPFAWYGPELADRADWIVFNVAASWSLERDTRSRGLPEPIHGPDSTKCWLAPLLWTGDYLADLRRGRCLADTDRMISLPRPLAGSGVFARAMAAAMSASISGSARTSTDSRRMKRV
jgi:hypothetical protein